MQYFGAFILLSCLVAASNAFVTNSFEARQKGTSLRLSANNNNNNNNNSDNDNNNNGFNVPNPFKEMGDMIGSLDDVVDDFLYKRMGGGEIFYGKRKYKPSGDVEGAYNGLGLTDKQRIDDAREWREMKREEMKRKKEEEEENTRI